MNTCSTCRAYKIDDGDEAGSCQLHPPILVGDFFMFPGVHPLAWCLDWQANPTTHDTCDQSQVITQEAQS